MTAPAVVLQKVTKSYADGERSNEILKGANLTITAGERVAIVGPSGSGKTTVAKALAERLALRPPGPRAA